MNDYFPYGSMRIDEKSSPQDSTSSKEQRKYIGQEFDASTGLSYLNARYYDGNRGQFLSQDPVFWSQNQNLPDPQSLNSYSYAGNNPINWSDPTGLFTKDSPANIVRNLMESVFNLTASISSLVNNLVRNPVESVQSAGQRINSVIAHPGVAVRGIADGTIQDAKSAVSGILSGDDATQERGISQAILFAGSLIAPQGRAARIADDALVVRGGGLMNQSAVRIEKQIAISQATGYNGFSVQCSNACTNLGQVGDLGQYLKNNQLSVTTAATIRAVGGDVIPTPGKSPFHATTVNLSGETASQLPWLVIDNPNPLR